MAKDPEKSPSPTVKMDKRCGRDGKVNDDRVEGDPDEFVVGWRRVVGS